MSDLPRLDTERANSARIYDWLLGGFHNFEVDREAGRAIERAWPNARQGAQANRSFLRRAVRYLANRGIDQFLDLGSGIPSVGTVHEIARAVNPAAKVVYVDNEPVAVKASELLLAGDPATGIVHADLRDPDSVLRHPTTLRLLDFDRPVAVMLVSVLHFVVDDAQATDVVRRYIAAMPPGGYLTISHITDPYEVAATPDDVRALDAVYAGTANPTHWRSAAAVRALFDGTEPVPPGLVHVLDWHPEGSDGFGDDVLARERTRLSMTAGIGRKP